MKENIWTNKNFWQAVATLIGTIVGAGILGIPFVVSRVGLWPGLFFIVLLGLASMILNLMIAEMLLRTRLRHQLVGLMQKYLGQAAKHWQALAMGIGYYGALTAYIIGEGEVLAAIFGASGISALWFSIIFFLGSVVVLLIGLKLIKVLEFWLVLLILLIVLVIVIVSLPAINITNFYYLDFSELFLPYGVILFAFGGSGAVFSIREILRQQERLIRPAVVLGSLFPILLYSIFALVVLGVTGLTTTDIATIGLGNALGPNMVLYGNLFAVLAMATSFLTLGIALRQMYRYDYHLPVWLAWLLVIIVPLLIFLLISQNFIQVIGTAGSLTFGLSGVLTVLAFWRAKKIGEQSPIFSLPKMRVIGSLLIVIFLFGVVYTIVGLL
jgi:amino acid permease